MNEIDYYKYFSVDALNDKYKNVSFFKIIDQLHSEITSLGERSYPGGRMPEIAIEYRHNGYAIIHCLKYGVKSVLTDGSRLINFKPVFDGLIQREELPAEVWEEIINYKP